MKAAAKSSLLVTSLILLTAAAAHESDRLRDPVSRSMAYARATLAQVFDTIRGTESADVLTGTAGSDVLTGLEGDDVLRGLDGDDAVDGGAGDDVLDGGAGSDILEAGDGGDRLSGGAGDDTLFGDDGDDLLIGGEDGDVMSGGAGADDLRGEGGDDTMDGGGDDDLLRGDDGDDLIDGSDGSDILFGGDGSDDLDGGDGDDVLSGGAGNDTMAGRDGQDQIRGQAGDDVLSGGDGADFVSGGAGDDEISGGDGDDVLRGEGGEDVIQGSEGSDQISGGADADVLFGGLGPDILAGGPGADRILGSFGDDRLDGGLDGDQLDGSVGTDQVFGGDGDDLVVLVAGDVDAEREEIIEGGAGLDTLLLSGFLPDHISEMVERAPPPPDSADADSTAMAELSFVLSDPNTGGEYRVSQMEVIRYETRLPVASGWENGARAVILNPSGTTANVALDFRGPDGSSLVTPAGDSVPGWTVYTIPPLGVLDVGGDELGVSGSAVVLLRSDVPVSAAVLGSGEGLGGFGQSNVPKVEAARSPLEIDLETQRRTALWLAADGEARTVLVQLVPEGGGDVDTREVELAADGHTIIGLEELFPRARAFTGSARVLGGSLFGSTVVTSGSGAVALPLASDVAFRHRPAPYYLPASVGAGGRTTFTLLQPPLATEEGQARGVLAFFDEQGNPTSGEVEGESGGTLESVPFSVGGGGSQRIVVAGTGPTSARLQVDSGTVTIVAHQELGLGGSVRRTAAIVGDRLVAPVLAPEGGTITGVAIQSTGAPATVELTLRGADGEPLGDGITQIDVPAEGSVAESLDDLFPEVSWPTGSVSLSVESSADVAVEVIHVNTGSGSGFAMPVHPLVAIE